MTDTTETKTTYNWSNDIQFIIVVGLLAGVVIATVGVFMAFLPAASGYGIDTATAIAKALVRQENGRMLTVVGAILTMGTGIMLILRSRLAR